MGKTWGRAIDIGFFGVAGIGTFGLTSATGLGMASFGIDLETGLETFVVGTTKTGLRTFVKVRVESLGGGLDEEAKEDLNDGGFAILSGFTGAAF